jgi:hypothetical protein
VSTGRGHFGGTSARELPGDTKNFRDLSRRSDGIPGAPVESRCIDVAPDCDGEVLPVGEVDIDRRPGVLCFGDQERRVYLGGGVVL